MRTLHRSLFGFALVASVSASQAVMGQLLSAGSPWDNVGMVISNGSGGSGVPISSRWLLTAAHVVRSGSGVVNSNASTTFRLGSLASSTNFNVDMIVCHPTDDVALIRTTTNLPGFYGINLNPVANQTAFDIVGYGNTGTYSGGTWTVTSSYGTRRHGVNVVSNSIDVGENSGFNRWRQVYRYDFDGDGVDFFGDGGPVGGGDSVGLSGDSGCGIFSNQSVFALHVGRMGGTGGTTTQFGTIGVGIQLSSYRDFIQNTTGVPEPGTMIALASGLGLLAARRRRAKQS